MEAIKVFNPGAVVQFKATVVADDRKSDNISVKIGDAVVSMPRSSIVYVEPYFKIGDTVFHENAKGEVLYHHGSMVVVKLQDDTAKTISRSELRK